MNERGVEITYDNDRVVIELCGKPVVEIKTLAHGTWAWVALTKKPLPLVVAQLLFVKLANLEREGRP